MTINVAATGTLTATGGDSTGNGGHGIIGIAGIEITNNGTLTASSGKVSGVLNGNGISSDDYVTLDGTGSLTAIGGTRGINTTNLIINDAPSSLHIEGGVNASTYTNNSGSAALDNLDSVGAISYTAGDICTVTNTVTGVTGYTTLAAALLAVADGDTITLLEDITYDDEITLTDKEVILNLNSFTLTINRTGDTAMSMTDARSITREEMAVMMYRYADVLGYSLPVQVDAERFGDAGSISAWASDAVTAMQLTGIVVGKPGADHLSGGVFDPKGTFIRAESAAVLHRFIELVISSRDAEGWSNANNDLTKRVYYTQNGVGLTGWQIIEDKWYYFGKDGILAVNTVIDGYEVGADGARK